MKNRNKVYDSLILIMQFGINMIVPIFLCVGLDAVQLCPSEATNLIRLHNESSTR